MENKIILGDCIEELKKLEENSVDAIITDPPYGLGFMNKEWDNPDKEKELIERKRSEERKAEGKSPTDAPFSQSVRPGLAIKGAKENKWFQEWSEKWSKEAIRVLKPGGYMLVCCATRMYHRMTCGIEDAGFEIRDTIMWLYGSGFPKSLNIGKQIDKRGGKYVDWRKFQKWLKDTKENSGYTNPQLDEVLGFSTKGGGMFGHFINPSQAQLPRAKTYKQMKEILKLDKTFDELIEEAEREITGKDGRGEIKEDMFFHKGGEVDKAIGYGKWDLKDKPATPEAKQWEGWGTALKPACEPIVVARKPLSEKNVALNVLKHGTGGINIDECRVKHKEDLSKKGDEHKLDTQKQGWGFKSVDRGNQGRFPANIILDEEAGKMLDEQSGISKSQTGSSTGAGFQDEFVGGKSGGGIELQKYSDKGGASRFFYCAKASKSERNLGCEDMEDKTTDDGREVVSDRPHQRGASQRKNNHPTVKPIKLMEYLIKLISREGAIVLDPFLGSGTTAIACLKLNHKFIGIEKEEEYVKIAQARIKPYLEQTKL